MENKVKLSIIVPAYNTKEYLRDCLDSLLDQGLDDYEIIVVNDGSTDMSQPLIDTYVAKYDHIHSLIKPNGGLGSARNFGLRFARGEYITFVDSDDMIEKGAYAKVLSKMEDSSDICIFDMKYWYEDDTREDHIQKGLQRKNEDIKKDLIMSPLSSCNKVYKKEWFLNAGLSFPEGLLYEDVPVVIKAYLASDKVVYIDEPFYIYRQRSQSIMNSAYSERANDIFKIMEDLYDDIDQKDKECYHDELEYLFIEQLGLYGAYRFLNYDKPYYKRMMEKAHELLKKCYPNYKRNPYIKDLNTKEKIFIALNFKLTYFIWHMYLKGRKR